MRIPLTLAAAIMISAFAPSAAEAQVAATIRVHGLPVGGYITIGDPYRAYYHRAPRVIIVERHHHHHPKKWKKIRKHYRPVIIFHDRRGGRYYDAWRPGLVEVRVYERDGRFYRYDDYDGRSRPRYRDRDWDDDRDDWDDDWDDGRRRW